MDVGGGHLIGMETTQLKDLLTRVRARTRKGAVLVQELSREEAKLRIHLSATSVSLASYLDNLKQVAECARLSEGEESKAIGESLANVVEWQMKVREGLAKMLKGWVVKDYKVDNFEEKEKYKSKFMCCLGSKSKKEEEDELMLRVLIKKALDRERLLYQPLTLGLKELVQVGSALVPTLSGAVEAEEALEKASQPKVVAKESLSMMRRTSLSSMASFSYSPGSRWSNSDSGVLSEQGLLGGTTPPTGRTEFDQSSSSSRPSSVCQTKSAQKDEEVCYSSVKRFSNNEEEGRGNEEIRYSTVRRSPSPCFSPMRSPSPALLSIQPPMIKDLNCATGTVGREKTGTQRASRPPTQRCGTSTKWDQVGPWGRSLSNSSLFPRPCSPTTSSAEDDGTSRMADKRREKRRRNLTQAVSFSSLGPELDEGRSPLHSPVLTPESDKLHLMGGDEVDNQPFWGPINPEECQQAAPLKERLNESILQPSEPVWNTPAHMESLWNTSGHTEENFLDSASTLPPPPPFLLEQSYQGRKPDQLYGIFEP